MPGILVRIVGSMVMLLLALAALSISGWGLLLCLLCVGIAVAIVGTSSRLFRRGWPGARETHDLEISQEVDPYFVRDHARLNGNTRERQKW